MTQDEAIELFVQHGYKVIGEVMEEPKDIPHACPDCGTLHYFDDGSDKLDLQEAERQSESIDIQMLNKLTVIAEGVQTLSTMAVAMLNAFAEEEEAKKPKSIKKKPAKTLKKHNKSRIEMALDKKIAADRSAIYEKKEKSHANVKKLKKK